MAKGVYRPETKVRQAMESLGVYKKEFDPVISIYCELMEQYQKLTEKYENSGYEFSETTASGSKKAPIVTTLESLRKDILAYSSQLGLTPAGLKKLKEDLSDGRNDDPLATALREMRDG